MADRVGDDESIGRGTAAVSGPSGWTAQEGFGVVVASDGFFVAEAEATPAGCELGPRFRALPPAEPFQVSVGLVAVELLLLSRW